MLLSRYGSLDAIYQMDVETAIELIQRAFEKREEDRAYLLYASAYPHFDKHKFVSFDEFYKKPVKTVSQATSEDILSRAERILKKAGEKRGNL